VSLAFEQGLRYAIIGPNGAGKTTYFNLLAGNLRPNSGQVLYEGRDVTGLDVTARARIGIARSFQRNSLFPEFTVRENLTLACSLREGLAPVFWRPVGRMTALNAEAGDIAEQVGLADMLNIPVRQISYGSQRQLEVALALACRPRVLLLDEPTSGMSPEETARSRVDQEPAARGHHRDRARHGHRLRPPTASSCRLRAGARAGDARRNPQSQIVHSVTSATRFGWRGRASWAMRCCRSTASTLISAIYIIRGVSLVSPAGGGALGRFSAAGPDLLRHAWWRRAASWSPSRATSAVFHLRIARADRRAGRARCSLLRRSRGSVRPIAEGS
jgi:ABC-type lipoprotein export system ATPase subunit